MTKRPPGQQVLIASSADGLVWSAPQPAVPRQIKENLVHCSVGLMASEHGLYLFCGTKMNLHDDKAAPGMHGFGPKARRWDLHSSQDGNHWQLRTPRLLDAGSGHNAIYEAPRFTRDGVLMCGGTHNGPAVFRWPGRDPTERPEVIAVPPTPGLRFPYGEATWHQTRDALIVMFWRDEAHSTRLHVNSSKDGGRSWTMPVITDIPNSMQRVYGGTLPNLSNQRCMPAVAPSTAVNDRTQRRRTRFRQDLDAGRRSHGISVSRFAQGPWLAVPCSVRQWKPITGSRQRQQRRYRLRRDRIAAAFLTSANRFPDSRKRSRALPDAISMGAQSLVFQGCNRFPIVQ